MTLPSNKDKELSLNLNVPFVLGKSNELVKPSECYLDSPYRETGLSCAEHIHHKAAINRIYRDRLLSNELECFIDILIQNGVFHSFEIIATKSLIGNKEYKKLISRPWYVERETYFDTQDWIIRDLSLYLALKNYNIALQVWRIIMKEQNHYYINHDKTVAYRQWQQQKFTKSKSQVAQILCDTAWIPDVDGNYKKPSELSSDSIDHEFCINYNSPFLTAIEFGKEENDRREKLEEEERRRTSEYQIKLNAAKALGYNNVDEFERDQLELAEYRRAKDEGRIIQERNIEEPIAKTNNIEKRTAAVIEDTNNAVDKTYEQKMRSVRISGVKSQAATMLRTLYTNKEDIMVCQCCGKELPFKKKNGEYYFETVELDKRGGEFFTSETTYPYIACCPNCAAMFNEHIVNCGYNENRIADLIEKIRTEKTFKKPNGNEIIEIIMDGKIFKLTFVQKHIVSIRAILMSKKK